MSVRLNRAIAYGFKRVGMGYDFAIGQAVRMTKVDVVELNQQKQGQ